MPQVGRAVAARGCATEGLSAAKASVRYLAVQGQLAGWLAVADPIPASTPEALSVRHRAGWRVTLATADGWTTARAVGARLGIDAVAGEVTPLAKLPLGSAGAARPGTGHALQRRVGERTGVAPQARMDT